MFGLVLSLGALLAVVHLPFADDGYSVGWYVATAEERLSVQHLEHRTIDSDGRGIASAFAENDQVPDRGEPAATDDDSGISKSQGDTRRTDVPRRLAGRKVLDYAQRMPQIVGGLGAYYIHIEYPEAAIREGIEGRLVLSFIVDTEGDTHQIEVIRSLHPSCDSAAVQALRRTRFVPGLQDGEPVEIRMRLPVRFQLVPHPSQDISALKG